MGREFVPSRPEQERKRETERARRQDVDPIEEALQRSAGTRNDPTTVLALQRSVGNRAVGRLFERGAPVSAAGHDKLARLHESHGVGGAGVVEEVDEDLDDEAAQHLYDPRRNPHTLGQYLLPALAAADARSQPKQAIDAKVKEAVEAKAKLEAEAKAKAEAEAKAKEAAELKAKLDAEAKAAAEVQAKQEAAAKAQEAAELKAKLEAEAKAKAVAEAKAKEEAEAKAKAAAEVKVKEAAEAQAKLEAEAKATAEAKAKEEAEAKAKAAAEAKAKLEAEAKAKQESEAKAKAEAAAKAKQEAAAKAKAEAEAKAKKEMEDKKAEIGEEMRKRLVELGTGVNRWAKLTAVQQETIVQQVFNQKATQAAYVNAKKDAEELVKAAVRAEQETLLKADKDLLKQGVTALGLSGDVLEIVTKAIDAHKKSDDSYGFTIDKAYPLASILEACRQWGLIARQRVDGTQISSKLKIISNLHSPGYDKDTIEWKPRGKYLERTRNLIALVGGLKSNVHVHTTGGWQKKA